LGDEARISKLLSMYFDNIKDTADWRRLYQESPYGEAIISLAEAPSSKELIGHYAILRLPLLFFGKNIKAGKGEGSALDPLALKRAIPPDARLNQDIFQGLVEFALENGLKEGMEIICTNPNTLALKAHLDTGHLELKHKFRIYLFIISKEYSLYLAGKLIKNKKLSNLAGKLTWYLLRILHMASLKISYRKNNIGLHPCDSFEGRLKKTIDALAAENRCISMQPSADYLNWKLSPASFKKFIVNNGHMDIGYLILQVRTTEQGYLEANLLDYAFKPQYWQEFGKTISRVLEFALQEKCDYLRVDHMFDYKERFRISRYLSRLFFISREDRRNIVLYLSNKLKAQKEDILDVRNWLFTDLYFELSQ